MRKKNLHCQGHQGCDGDDNAWISRKKKGKNQTDEKDSCLYTVKCLTVAKVALVEATIWQDRSLEEPDTSVKETCNEEMMGFWIDQETHRHSYHNQANKNWIVAVNKENPVVISFFVNGMVELSEVKEEKKDHDDEVENGVDRESFWSKEVSNSHNHLAKGNDDQ